MGSIKISRMSAGRSMAYAFALAAATFAMWFAARSAAFTWVTARTAMAQTTPRIPLTVKYKVAKYQASGQPVFSESSLAIRADGSRVTVRSVAGPDGTKYDQRFIDDLAASKHIVVEGATQSVTTYVLSDREVQRYRSATCDDGKYGGLILGYRVVTGKISAGSDRVLETSFAPDLGCLALREILLQVDANGTARTLLQKDATELRFGEPDPMLFAVPSWPERSPSEVSAEYQRRFAAPIPDQRADEGADRAYQARQSRRP